MDWHPVISVQQQTPDNDFCDFSISNVRFHFGHFFENRKKSGLTPGRNDDSVTRTWKMTQVTRWPGDPMTQLHVWYIDCHRDAVRIWCWAPAPAALRSQRHRSYRWAANSPHAAAAVDRWDRQTVRRTDGRPTVTQILLRIQHRQCQ